MASSGKVIQYATAEKYHDLHITDYNTVEKLEAPQRVKTDEKSMKVDFYDTTKHMPVNIFELEKSIEDSSYVSDLSNICHTEKTGIVVFLFENDFKKEKNGTYKLNEKIAELDKNYFNENIKSTIEFCDFKGKKNSEHVLHGESFSNSTTCNAKLLCLYGMGERDQMNTFNAKSIGFELVKIMRKYENIKNWIFIQPLSTELIESNKEFEKDLVENSREISKYFTEYRSSGKIVGVGKTYGDSYKNRYSLTKYEFRALMEEILYASYTDIRYKKEENFKKHTNEYKYHFGVFGNESLNYYNEIINEVYASANGRIFAAQLVNTPANICNPITLADSALQLSKLSNLDCKIFSVNEMENLNMGSALSVGKGSMYPPMFIHLTYKPDEKKNIKKKIAFVGKGVCFDAGGYNMKSMSSKIHLMKFDMGGAAAVLGAARIISYLKPNDVQVEFIIPAVENMVSRFSYRPGDVITASNGKTIEVGNTDAEGRLILADALVYAEKLKVDAIVDVATLTGACIVALGSSVGGLFSSNTNLVKDIELSAARYGEKFWRLPMVEEYAESLESKVADLNNIGAAGQGGSTVAAMFLRNFVSDETAWAHLDIAGPAWHDQFGATAMGANTLAYFAINTDSSFDTTH